MAEKLLTYWRTAERLTPEDLQDENFKTYLENRLKESILLEASQDHIEREFVTEVIYLIDENVYRLLVEFRPIRPLRITSLERRK